MGRKVIAEQRCQYTSAAEWLSGEGTGALKTPSAGPISTKRMGAWTTGPASGSARSCFSRRPRLPLRESSWLWWPSRLSLLRSGVCPRCGMLRVGHGSAFHWRRYRLGTPRISGGARRSPAIIASLHNHSPDRRLTWETLRHTSAPAASGTCSIAAVVGLRPERTLSPVNVAIVQSGLDN